jgi:hypothetical protein
MAIEIKRKKDDTYGKLLGMTGQPSATPTRRVGAETPTGSAAAGPKGGQTPEEFTATTQASPGSVFKRQIEGAKRSGIGGITALAEKPLGREFGAELSRVAQEGIEYKNQGEEQRKEEPQFDFSDDSIVQGLASGDEETTNTAQQIFNRGFIPTEDFTTQDIKEFTPQQALRGGSVESVLRKEAKGPYTTGMAGLDALLFKRGGGSKELAQKGMALRGAGQAAANVLQGKSTGILDEAAQKALETIGLTGNLTKEQEELNKQFVEQQKSDLEAILRGELDPRLASYEQSLEGLRSGRAAAIVQQNQALQDYINSLGAAQRNQLYNQIYTENPRFEGYQSAIGPDYEAMRRSLAGLDFAKELSPYLSYAAVTDPTMADVAATDPTKAQEYSRLLNLLSLGSQDTAKYGLGQRTQQATSRVTVDEATLKNAIKDLLDRTVAAAPQIDYTKI